MTENVTWTTGTCTTGDNTNITWIGDPLPDWNDYTVPLNPGYVQTYPYYPPQKDDTEELKRFIEKALSEKTETKKEVENLMTVYEITVVDKRECEILHEQKVIAKDTETAMLELDLTPEIKKKVRKNLVEFIFNEIGSFKKVERKIKLKDLEDEED